MFNVDESTEFEALFAAGFNNAPQDIQFVSTEKLLAIYDCSHVRHSSESRTATPPGSVRILKT